MIHMGISREMPIPYPIQSIQDEFRVILRDFAFLSLIIMSLSSWFGLLFVCNSMRIFNKRCRNSETQISSFGSNKSTVLSTNYQHSFHNLFMRSIFLLLFCFGCCCSPPSSCRPSHPRVLASERRYTTHRLV